MICCNWKTVWIKFSSSSWREKGKWPKHTDLSSVAMSRKQMLHLHLLRSPNGCSHFISPSLLLLPHWTSSLSLPLSSSQFYLPPQTLRGVLPPSSSLLGLLLAPNPPLPPSPSDISPCSLLPSELQKGTFIRGLQIPPYLYLATVLFFFSAGKCFCWALAKLRVFEAITVETPGDFWRVEGSHIAFIHTQRTPEPLLSVQGKRCRKKNVQLSGAFAAHCNFLLFQ